MTLKLLNMPSLDETGIKMADYMGQNAQVCQNNIYFLFVTCVSMSKARLPNLFGIRALFISTFPPEKKKKKRSDSMETGGNEAFT